MNKSLLTNLVALAVCVLSFLVPDDRYAHHLLSTGLFALSGAITNWLAIHMLFEKVPGLYGSGVIEDRFEDFKSAIKQLVIENFFTEENFKKFTDEALHKGMSHESIESMIDLDDVFDSFLNVIENSKLKGALALFGGVKALEPLRAPFKVEFRHKIVEIIDDLDLTKGSLSYDSFRPTVESLVQGKLDELKPTEVKRILEQMIREHLGWLVVWGGLFGGVIGLASSFFLTI